MCLPEVLCRCVLFVYVCTCECEYLGHIQSCLHTCVWSNMHLSVPVFTCIWSFCIQISVHVCIFACVCVSVHTHLQNDTAETPTLPCCPPPQPSGWAFFPIEEAVPAWALVCGVANICGETWVASLGQVHRRYSQHPAQDKRSPRCQDFLSSHPLLSFPTLLPPAGSIPDHIPLLASLPWLPCPAHWHVPSMVHSPALVVPRFLEAKSGLPKGRACLLCAPLVKLSSGWGIQL